MYRQKQALRSSSKDVSCAQKNLKYNAMVRILTSLSKLSISKRFQNFVLAAFVYTVNEEPSVSLNLVYSLILQGILSSPMLGTVSSPSVRRRERLRNLMEDMNIKLSMILGPGTCQSTHGTYSVERVRSELGRQISKEVVRKRFSQQTSGFYLVVMQRIQV